MMMGRTRDLLGELVGEENIRWMMSRRSSFEDELEEIKRSSSSERKWISQLSPLANVVVARCSKTLDITMNDLQKNFEAEASDGIKNGSCYARNFLEYCCFRAISLSSQSADYLSDKGFRRLTFDAMLAWDSPSCDSLPEVKVDGESTVKAEAFSRIAPSVAVIADIITSPNIFEVLTSSTPGSLPFNVYDKYLSSLDRMIKKMKTQTNSSHLSNQRVERGERIIGMEGTLTTQPVLEHIGMSIWPGRLTLTDHTLYFEPLKVLTYDKPKIYDLATDLKQIIRPELTGPWGARLFDKGVLFKASNLSDPVVLEFPEFSGNSRRDYWVAIIQEILYAHQFIRKYRIQGVERERALSRAVLSIIRLQSLEELFPTVSLKNESLLMFNLTYHLPGGDSILETLAGMLRASDRTNQQVSPRAVSPTSALSIFGNLGLSPRVSAREGILVGEVVVGETSPLESAVRESRQSFEAAEVARASVDVVKVEGINNNVAVMKELLYPVTKFGNFLALVHRWDDPSKSIVFCALTSYVIYRGWITRVFSVLLLFMASFLAMTRLLGEGRAEVIRVEAPPPLNTVENLLAVQNAISVVQEFAQDGIIVLLKIRSLLLAIPPQATNQVIIGLFLVATALVLLPIKLIFFAIFSEFFTRYSPPRRLSTERWMRRLREWWVSIPAAPVALEINVGDKKTR